MRLGYLRDGNGNDSLLVGYGDDTFVTEIGGGTDTIVDAEIVA